ncbi:hypothetical protein QE374_003166 [Microbacterium sp. SORGH_AS428]|uniref:hypothetical protein n=1 Tax=Microbacterium sp. SORGH_AS_0428 TaxID=3041788 RepID=UPI00286230DA|nr:hypothetical protein [Microbacterium sp. SORGH_AS_0428]MDR6201257.1 hypothetical protein [Microbacterium sp. SORGH_AS_0428]
MRPTNSIQIVEDFFGGIHLESPSFELPAHIPLSQLTVLAESLEEAARALENRRGDSTAGSRPFAADTVILNGGRRASTATIAEVKQQVLLCDRSYVPDLLLDWGARLAFEKAMGFRNPSASAARGRSELEAAISHIRPLAAAIRLGLLEPVPTADSHYLENQIVSRDIRDGSFGFMAADPATRAILQNELGASDFQLQDSYTDGELLTSVERDLDLGVTPQLATEVLSRYGSLSMRELGDAIHFYRFCGALDAQPITTARTTARHFELATAALLGAASVRAADAAPAELTQGFVLPMPELARVSFPDLVELRQHDEIWTTVRDALTTLSSDVRAIESVEMDYLSFLAAFRDAASTTLADSAKELQSALTKQRWKSRILTWSGAGVARAVLRGAAVVFAPAALAAGPAAAATSKIIQRRSASRISALTTANTVLLSLSEKSSLTPQHWGGEG